MRRAQRGGATVKLATPVSMRTLPSLKPTAENPPVEPVALSKWPTSVSVPSSAMWMSTSCSQIVDSLQDDFGITQIDLPGWLESTGLPGPEARPDGVHLAEEVGVRFVSEMLVPRLLAIRALPQ